MNPIEQELEDEIMKEKYLDTDRAQILFRLRILTKELQHDTQRVA